MLVCQVGSLLSQTSPKELQVILSQFHPELSQFNLELPQFNPDFYPRYELGLILTPELSQLNQDFYPRRYGT